MIVRTAALMLTIVCGAASAQARPLVLWHAYRGDERAALEQTVAQWNSGGRGSHPRLQLLAVPFDALADKISAAIPRGHGPDLFIYPGHDRIGDWAASRIVEPIEFWITEAHADHFVYKTIDALCYGDSLYGLPLAFKTTALFYNKDLVDRPPRTTDELLALGRRLTDSARGRYGLVYDNIKLYFHAPWLFGFGGTLFDARQRLRVDSKEAEAALAFARALGGPGGIVPPEASATLTASLFNSGRAAMAISGPWLLAELSPKVRVGIAPLPRVSATGRRAMPFLGVEAVMISARSQRKTAAFAAAKFLTSDAMARLRAARGRQPVANLATWEDPAVAKDPLLAPFRRQLEWSVVMPATPEMRLVWSPYDMALQKVVAGGAAPREALREAQAEIRRYLQASRASRRRQP